MGLMESEGGNAEQVQSSVTHTSHEEDQHAEVADEGQAAEFDSPPARGRNSIDLTENLFTGNDANPKYHKLMYSKSEESIKIRVSMMKAFNKILVNVISFLDLMADDENSIGAKIRQVRHCILLEVKTSVMENALRKTFQRARLRIVLDRYAAAQSKERGNTQPDKSRCCFVQGFEQLHKDGSVQAADLRGYQGEKLFEAGWDGAMGEQGIDAGGPYREALTAITTDIFDEAKLSLFVHCPNGVHERGINRDKFIPNPRHSDPLAISMFEFVGKWLGVSYRTKSNLPFMLPSIVWKHLVGESKDIKDLEGIDVHEAKLIQNLRKCSSQEDFQESFAGLHYTSLGSDGILRELESEGSTTEVNFSNRIDYAQKLELYRLHEFDQQLNAIARGFSTLIPERLCRIFTWEELEVNVCGSPKISVEILKKHTIFEGVPQETQTIFWTVFTEWNNEQRSRWIEFAYGRKRLPRPGQWSRPMKITRLGNDTNVLPQAHTCFFNVELPPYKDIAVARKFMMAAIEFGLGSMMNV